MVVVVKADRGPLVHIHAIERHVHGNGIHIKIWGEMKIAAKERVYARELYLNTIKVLLLTVETGQHYPLTAQKWVYNKGEFDNYASIDIFCSNGWQMEPDGRVAVTCPATLGTDGSLWLNFMALGE